MAESGGLLNRCTGLNLYPGFESLPHRQPSNKPKCSLRSRLRLAAREQRAKIVRRGAQREGGPPAAETVKSLADRPYPIVDQYESNPTECGSWSSPHPCDGNGAAWPSSHDAPASSIAVEASRQMFDTRRDGDALSPTHAREAAMRPQQHRTRTIGVLWRSCWSYRERGLPSMPIVCVIRVVPVPSRSMTKISVSRPVPGRDVMK